MSKLNLSQFDVVNAAEEGAWMDVYTPSGEKSEARIKLLGTDSKVYRDRVRANLNSRLNKKPGKRQDIDFDREERKGLELLAKMTITWEGIYNEEKDPDTGELVEVEVVHSFESAIALYKQYPWIKEQVDEFVADRNNFLKNA